RLPCRGREREAPGMRQPDRAGAAHAGRLRGPQDPGRARELEESGGAEVEVLVTVHLVEAPDLHPPPALALEPGAQEEEPPLARGRRRRSEAAVREDDVVPLRGGEEARGA